MSDMAVHRRVVLVLATLVVAVGAGFGVLALRAPDKAPALPAQTFPDLLMHVHGLDVNPADGALYAATHAGVFRLPAGPAGQAVRVADRWQDTMAFTVVGDDEFLASGHPDLREDKPDVLGLIGSRDAGQTWEPLSREGSSDFHALEPAGEVLFGYDSTSEQLLVTEDRRSWQPRAAVALSALAADPTDAGVLLAVGIEGRLLRSDDGGRTFTPVPGAPSLTLLTWAPAGPVFGADAGGTVLVSSDDGGTWQTRGTLDGPAQAITAETSTILHAATGTGIYRSTDGGAEFETRYQAELDG